MQVKYMGLSGKVSRSRTPLKKIASGVSAPAWGIWSYLITDGGHPLPPS